jgi:hypothetical protein
MAGNIGLLRDHMTQMMGSVKLPKVSSGKRITKIKRLNKISTIQKTKSGATTKTTPTIGGY